MQLDHTHHVYDHSSSNPPPLSRRSRPARKSSIFGAGCFWCTEAVFQQIPGVLSVTSGYMGGATVNPTYEQICEGDTGHAEITRVVFDPKKVSWTILLELSGRCTIPPRPTARATMWARSTARRSSTTTTSSGPIAERASRLRRTVSATHRHGDRAGGDVLPGGKLPSGLLQSEQEPELRTAPTSSRPSSNKLGLQS